MTLQRAQIETFFTQQSATPIQRIELPETQQTGIELWLKRDDLIHEKVSGNKFRKLKYNVLQGFDLGKTRFLSFGGAYSNHIYALAALGKLLGLETIGVIRGEELDGDNPTLSFAQQCGMQLYFISRSQYRSKDDPTFIASLEKIFGDFYLVPEGGTNPFALTGCEELAREITNQIVTDYVCVASGTGGTLAGLATGFKDSSCQLLGFPVLKGGEFLQTDIEKLLGGGSTNSWKLVHNYHFGGYARMTKSLALFILDFLERTGVQLDPVYTGKMMYGVLDLIKQGMFPHGSKIVAVHTGGLQGLEGKRQQMARLTEEL